MNPTATRARARADAERMAPTPAQRVVFAALAAARWAAFAWLCAQLVVAWRANPASPDAIEHPVTLGLVVAAVLAVTVTASVDARHGPRWVLRGTFTAVDLTAAFALYVADGWVFTDGHTFNSQIALSSSWTLVTALTAAAAHGATRGALLGGLLPVGRVIGAAVDGADFTAAHILSFASSIAFYATAGGVLGALVTRLTDVETANARYQARVELERELHDSVLQTLALVARRTSDPELEAAARASDAHVRSWLRRGTSQHHPGEPFTTRLERAVTEAASRFGTTVSYSTIDEPEHLPDAVAEALVGAASEAVTNAAKHAGVPTVRVLVDYDHPTVTISIRDHGPGFDTTTMRPSVGWTSSIEGRMNDIGGTADLRTSPGNGCEVILEWAP